jgi:hypothetical protein|tara:strand:+ start:655 stop:1278 length:624 start_codon:yes stop_codon:yes gene_type:complete
MGLISNGTTVFDAGAMSLGGSMTFMKKLTASNSATLSFVHGSGGVDFSTFKEYLFTFKNIHHSTDGEATFAFQGSIDAGSNYNVAITSTMIQAYHGEDASGGAVGYYTGGDQAQGTGLQLLNAGGTGGDNDQSCSGYLHLFNPSSTTFVKHFIAVTNISQDNDNSNNGLTSGYFNTTSDIDAIRFAPGRDTGPTILASGDICMYGIK